MKKWLKKKLWRVFLKMFKDSFVILNCETRTSYELLSRISDQRTYQEYERQKLLDGLTREMTKYVKVEEWDDPEYMHRRIRASVTIFIK